jgi:uncharacterized phiE125 gp8 family phage protein
VTVLPVADLKIHLNLPDRGTADDDELREVLDAAVEVVENLIGPLGVSTVTEIHRGVSSDMLVLRRMPIGELTAVSARYATGVATPLDLVDFELDAATGILRVVTGARFWGTFVVEYTTGRAAMPAAVRLAILIVAAHLWETQRMPGQSRDSLPAGFGGADGIPDATLPSRGFAIPNRAQELLQPYISGGVVA